MKRFAVSFLTILLLSLFPGCRTYDYDYYGSISGTVSDYDSGAPIGNAEIVLMPDSKSLQTASDGSFLFEGLEAGQYTLSVRKNGYQSNRKTVDVISGEIAETAVTLTPIHN